MPDYTSDEINDLVDKLQALVIGFPAPVVGAAAAMLLVNVTAQKAPSIEKACSAIRIAARNMQDDVRARWDHIRSNTSRS